MSQRPDPKFFAELNRRLDAGQQLAQQNDFAAARAAFSGVFQFSAAANVTIPISLVFDTWTSLFWCALGLNDFAGATAIVRATEAFLAEWQSKHVPGQPPSSNPNFVSFELVRPLLPPDLRFVVPNNFDATADLARLKVQQAFIDPHLDTLNLVLRTLYDFAGFYCGASVQTGQDSNWHVLQDWMMSFSPNHEQQRYDGGMLYINRSPIVAVGAALTPDGCWVALMKEFHVPEIDRQVLQPIVESTIPPDRLALWAFLNNWITTGVLIPTGDRFKLGIE